MTAFSIMHVYPFILLLANVPAARKLTGKDLSFTLSSCRGYASHVFPGRDKSAAAG